MTGGFKATKWTVLDGFVMNVFSVLVFFGLARILDVSSFGLVNISMFLIMFLTQFVNFGFRVAIIQRKDLSPDALDSVFWTIISLGVLGSCGLFFLKSQIAVFFNQPDLERILSYFSLVLFFNASAMVPTALLQKELSFKSIALRNIIASFLSGVCALVLAYRGYGVDSLVWQQVSYSAIGATVIWLAVRWRPRLVFSYKSLKEVAAYARIDFTTSIFNTYNREGLRLFISYFLGPAALGFYSMANKLSSLSMNLLALSLTKVSLPYFSKLQNDKSIARQRFYRITGLSAAAVYPILSLLFIFIEDLVLVFLDEKWSQSISVFKILVIAAYVLTLSRFNGTVITALGKARWRMILSVFSSLLGTVLFTIGCLISLEAAVYAFLLRVMIIDPIQFYLVGRLLEISWLKYFAQLLLPVCLCMLIFPVVMVLRDAGLTMISSLIERVLLSSSLIMLSLMVYALCLYFFDRDRASVFVGYIRSKK